jgi:hypothetical protein
VKKKLEQNRKGNNMVIPFRHPQQPIDDEESPTNKLSMKMLLQDKDFQ